MTYFRWIKRENGALCLDGYPIRIVRNHGSEIFARGPLTFTMGPIGSDLKLEMRLTSSIILSKTMPDKLKTTEPMILAENLEITDEREAEIERLRAIIGDLLAAAKEVLPLTRLIELPTPSMKNVFSELRAAIAAAEEQAL